MLNTSGDSRHPYTVPDLLGESYQSFHSGYDINYGFFINAFYNVKVIEVI